MFVLDFRVYSGYYASRESIHFTSDKIKNPFMWDFGQILHNIFCRTSAIKPITAFSLSPHARASFGCQRLRV